MTYAIGSYDDFLPAGRLRSSRKRSFQLLPALVGLAGSALVAALILDVEPALAPGALSLGSHLPKVAASAVIPLADAAVLLAFSAAPILEYTGASVHPPRRHSMALLCRLTSRPR